MRRLSERGLWSSAFLMLGAAALLPAGAAPLEELALHYAMRTASPPVLDGKLDEPCWQAAPEFTRYRTLYGDHVQPTSIRLVWDDKGLYAGMVNTEANPSRLRVSVRTRDGGQLWKDDSVEFYLDPTCSGSTMYVFQINSVGAIGDYWQVDAGFADHAWSASSARAAGGRAPEVWTLEFFVAWDDLKRKPDGGDLWLMMQVRFSWTGTDGKICGVSTSGGNFYNRTFGYLYFADGAISSAGQLGDKLQRIVAKQPWVVQYGDGWLYRRDGDVVLLASEAIVERERGQAQQALARLAETLADGGDDAAKRSFDALQTRMDETSAAWDSRNPFPAMAAFSAIADEARALTDEAGVQALIDSELKDMK